MTDSQAPGVFISIDGVDNCGKSTQIALLAEWLQAAGRTVVTCRDPGGTAIGERIREILLDRSCSEMTRRAEMLLYMASRSQLVGEVVAPALARGDVVICDRFLLANVVYQGFAAGLGVDLLWEVGRVAIGGVAPDLTIVLDVDPQTAARRSTAEPDRMEQRGLAFQQRVRQGFLQEAAKQPERIHVIAADGPVEAVAVEIRKEVDRVVQSR